MFRHILVPTDGSELADLAVDRAIGLAKALGSRVSFLTVLEPYRALTLNPGRNRELIEAHNAATAKAAEEILGGALEKARAAGVEASSVVRNSDHPWLEIDAAAEATDADLIVISSHGRTGLARVALGSQTARLLTATKLPVLVVR